MGGHGRAAGRRVSTEKSRTRIWQVLACSRVPLLPQRPELKGSATTLPAPWRPRAWPGKAFRLALRVSAAPQAPVDVAR